MTSPTRLSLAAVGMALLAGVSCREEANNTGPTAPAELEELSAAAGNTWAAKRSLSPWRTYMAADTINRVIYVVGGRRRSEPYTLARVDAYNIATNTWTQVASLPAARDAVNGASTINGKLYVSGGRNKDSQGTRTLFVYDPLRNSWSRKADMPQTGCGGSQGAIGGRLYVYIPPLGSNFSSTCYPSTKGRFFRYNPATNTWVTRAAPPTDHKGGAGGVINGKFYLAGGWKLDPCTVNGEPVDCEGLDNALHAYDPASNTWTTKAPMSAYREIMASAVLNGKLFLMGGNGWPSDYPLTTVEVYDPVINKWTMKARLPRGSAAGAAAAASGKVYYIEGGLAGFEPGYSTDPSKVYAYTP